jgi:hypothetical protein
MCVNRDNAAATLSSSSRTLVYAVAAVIHFFQHLDHLEVDWAHLLLTVSSIAAVVGVLWVVAERYASRRAGREAMA